MQAFNLPLLLGLVAVMLFLRWRRVGMLAWALAWWLGSFALIKYGFVVPVPASVRAIYIGIITCAILAYVSSNPERWREFTRPIVELVIQPRKKLLLALVVVALPALVAFNTYLKLSVPLQAPAFGRTVHPAPPDTITVHDREIDLVRGDNPYRPLQRDDPQAFAEHVANGRRVYFQNCFYCHGDAMAGDGMFAHALNPIPSNFTDPGVLPMLQESFLFWRVAKGAPGLPEEGGPWDSAMPAWEEFLSEEEIWDVILFLYDYNGYEPRALEEHH